MGQVLGSDNIPPLQKISTTLVSIAATHMGQQTKITVGGQQYRLSSAINCDLTVSGVGGVQSGSLSSMALWYVYAVITGVETIALIASQSGPSTGPTGYSNKYRLVGAFYCDAGGYVGSTVTIDGDAATDTFDIGVEQFGSTNNTAFSNTTITSAKGFRSGDHLFIEVLVTFTGTPAVGLGQLGFRLLNLQCDSSKTILTGLMEQRTSFLYTNSAAYTMFPEGPYNTSGNILFYFRNIDGQTGTNSSFQPAAGVPVAITSNHRFRWSLKVPISGWSKTLLG